MITKMNMSENGNRKVGYKYLLFIYLKILLFLCFTLTAASEHSHIYAQQVKPIQKPDPQPVKKSEKRGLAFNLVQSADLHALKGGVSWWYNWYYKTDAPQQYYEEYQMEFIPMLWGWNPKRDFNAAKRFILDHPEIEYLLVLNEPNLLDQANQTPSKSAREWPKYEKLIRKLENEGRKVKLVGPAMTWGTMDNYGDPIIWLDAFYKAYQEANNGKDPRIDYLAFHWYDFGLEIQLDRLKKYGKKIWITEMANWNPIIDSYEKQAEQMRKMVALCETRDDVFRYAWFIGRGDYPDEHYTYLFDAEAGKLTELGKLYINLPFAE